MTISEVNNIRCDFQCDGPIELPNNFVATHLYRIAQEAVNNALKHSNSDRIRISLSKSNKALTLAVLDYGVGMAAESGSKSGMGMHTMQYRASLIGATLRVGPGKIQGTLVNCELQEGG
jgi:signal transduction histidine kinase